MNHKLLRKIAKPTSVEYVEMRMQVIEVQSIFSLTLFLTR